MSIYRVTYQSMTAFYGPDFIEADSPDEARAKCTAFSRSEWPLLNVREVSASEMRRALRDQEAQP